MAEDSETIGRGARRSGATGRGPLFERLAAALARKRARPRCRRRRAPGRARARARARGQPLDRRRRLPRVARARPGGDPPRQRNRDAQRHACRRGRILAGSGRRCWHAQTVTDAPLIDLSVGAPDFDDLVETSPCPARHCRSARAATATSRSAGPSCASSSPRLLSRARSAYIARGGVDHQRRTGSDQPRGRPRGSGRASNRRRVARVSKRPGRDRARRRPATRDRARRRRPARRQPQTAARAPPRPRASTSLRPATTPPAVAPRHTAASGSPRSPPNTS